MRSVNDPLFGHLLWLLACSDQEYHRQRPKGGDWEAALGDVAGLAITRNSGAYACGIRSGLWQWSRNNLGCFTKLACSNQEFCGGTAMNALEVAVDHLLAVPCVEVAFDHLHVCRFNDHIAH